ncbi:MAG: hypothetical protein K6B44_10350 [Lachnospiraceae bacterium]|nr:hypothetical protein [Lachnospiraceae bacterium]
MKTKILRRLLSISLVSVLAFNLTACGHDNDGSTDNTETAPADEAVTPSTDAGNNSDPEPEQPSPTPEVIEEQKGLTKADCEERIEALRKTEAVIPTDEEVLTEMASCAVFSRILDRDGMIFSEMDNADRASLRSEIIDSVIWGETALYEKIMTTVNDEYAIPVEEAEKLFRDFYGEEGFVPYEYERVENGYIYPLFADGEPWHRVEHMQYFEDDDHILFTGPSFYESNGGDQKFIAYADILFAKNTDSRYGVTLLYGRYRDEKINIVSVETSSELPPSGDKTYSGNNLTDDDPATIWAEGVKGTGVGETIVIHLDKPSSVYGVVICNGYTASYEQYRDNGIVTETSADFGNGNVVKNEVSGYWCEGYTSEDLADINNTKLELEKPVVTDTIVITITGASAGEKYDDTCISGITVY